MSREYKSRKLWLASFFSCVGTVALFTDKLNGNEFVMLSGLILGLYGAANVMSKKVEVEDTIT